MTDKLLSVARNADVPEHAAVGVVGAWPVSPAAHEAHERERREGGDSQGQPLSLAAR